MPAFFADWTSWRPDAIPVRTSNFLLSCWFKAITSSHCFMGTRADFLRPLLSVRNWIFVDISEIRLRENQSKHKTSMPLCQMKYKRNRAKLCFVRIISRLLAFMQHYSKETSYPNSLNLERSSLNSATLHNLIRLTFGTDGLCCGRYRRSDRNLSKSRLDTDNNPESLHSLWTLNFPLWTPLPTGLFLPKIAAG